MEVEVIINNKSGVVRAYEAGIQVGQLDFIFIQDGLSIEHTRTFQGYEGKGIANALVSAVTDYAVENGLKIKPVCSYAKVWYKRHPQFDNILM
uniref:N-acetyltransferase domain-containing protein n=1 Tax=Prevotella sp. GTC17260 TaxID=3236796 RepID=A0AB33J8N0_9BACT